MKVSIQLRGQTYTVRSDQDDVDLHEVARYVDARMREVSGSTRTLDDYTIALLAALNIASDFRRLQRQVDGDLADLDRELAAATLLLESEAGGPDGDETDGAGA